MKKTTLLLQKSLAKQSGIQQEQNYPHLYCFTCATSCTYMKNYYYILEK